MSQAERIAPKWREIDQDNLRMKFLALNVDFGRPSTDPYRFKEACARGRQRGRKRGNPKLKSRYFTVVG